MKTKFILIGALTILLTGCQTSSTAINKIQPGMSERDVVSILGQPKARINNADGSTTLEYTLNESRVQSLHAPYFVRMVDGKVESYGRESGHTERTSDPHWPSH